MGDSLNFQETAAPFALSWRPAQRKSGLEAAAYNSLSVKASRYRTLSEGNWVEAEQDFDLSFLL